MTVDTLSKPQCSEFSDDLLSEILEYSWKERDIFDFNARQLNQMNDLIQQRVSIAVVGQSNAGKSTFLNALLGASLLPSGPLQCSSELITIEQGDDFSLYVEFADGSNKNILGSPSLIRKALFHIASINDDFRSLPATQLDKLIVDAGETSVLIDEKKADDIEHRTGINIRLHCDSLAAYLSQRKIKDIPVSIVIKSPMVSSGLVYIDSPGSNATGGFCKSLNTISDSASMLMITHDLSLPVEHNALYEMVHNSVELYSSKNIYLVLTKAGKCSSFEVRDKLSEIKRIFGSIISEKNIIVTDSIAHRLLSELKVISNVEKLLAIYKAYIKDEKLNGRQDTNHQLSDVMEMRKLLLSLEDDFESIEEACTYLDGLSGIKSVISRPEFNQENIVKCWGMNFIRLLNEHQKIVGNENVLDSFVQDQENARELLVSHIDSVSGVNIENTFLSWLHRSGEFYLDGGGRWLVGSGKKIDFVRLRSLAGGLNELILAINKNVTQLSKRYDFILEKCEVYASGVIVDSVVTEFEGRKETALNEALNSRDTVTKLHDKWKLKIKRCLWVSLSLGFLSVFFGPLYVVLFGLSLVAQAYYLQSEFNSIMSILIASKDMARKSYNINKAESSIVSDFFNHKSDMLKNIYKDN